MGLAQLARIEDEVAELAGGVVAAAHELAVGDDGGTDASADGDRGEVGDASPRPRQACAIAASLTSLSMTRGTSRTARSSSPSAKSCQRTLGPPRTWPAEGSTMAGTPMAAATTALRPFGRASMAGSERLVRRRHAARKGGGPRPRWSPRGRQGRHGTSCRRGRWRAHSRRASRNAAGPPGVRAVSGLGRSFPSPDRRG